MLNPYSLLTPEILKALTRQPMYFVRQNYPRGKFLYDGEGVQTLLLTHYIQNDVDRERAERHMRLLKKDKYRFLYDSTDQGDIQKLLTAATQPPGYRIYINLMETNWKASASLKIKIRAYVTDKLPFWKYSPADKLKITLKERYGQLHLAFLWKGQHSEVHLDEIENYVPCATT